MRTTLLAAAAVLLLGGGLAACGTAQAAPPAPAKTVTVHPTTTPAPTTTDTPTTTEPAYTDAERAFFHQISTNSTTLANGSASGLLTIGKAICQDEAAGTTPSDEVTALLPNAAKLGYSQADVQVLVQAASVNLCG